MSKPSLESKVRLRKIDKRRFRNRSGLRVKPDQESFVSKDLAAFVQRWKTDARFECYEIRCGRKSVGFLALDFERDRHPYVVAKSACVLRNLLIDARLQGRGLASRALERLGGLFSKRTTVFLTVNFRNEKAIGLYRKAGFSLRREPYLGGSHGPQYVMSKAFAGTGNSA